MKNLFLLTILIINLLLVCCASILSPSSQTITIKSDQPNTKITVDSESMSPGETANTTISKDFRAKQIIGEVEGWKKEYTVLVQDHKSYLYIMSWIPFVVVGAPFFDYGPKSYFYDDAVFINFKYKYPKWDSSQKRIIFKNVSFDVKKDSNVYNEFSHSYFNNNYEADSKIYSDSIKYYGSKFEEPLEEMLVKTNYIDTLNNVFMDNQNTLALRCNITYIDINEVKRYYIHSSKYSMEATYFNSLIKGSWTFEDIYGDTVLVEPFISESGLFSSDFYKTDEAIILSLKDALESSLISTMNKSSVKKIKEYDTLTKINLEQIKINKPSRKPQNIEESMIATVTIKSPSGHGSGFFISNDGYIITNHHVINDKAAFEVILNDGRKFAAKVIRSNKILDLALLKIEGNFDFAFEIPTSKNYKVGEGIFAIGTPKSVDLGQSVSKGIISNSRKYKHYNYLQSDVSVNKGNSGGPMINEKGDLISIVEYKILGIGTEGISFSIPAEEIFNALGINY